MCITFDRVRTCLYLFAGADSDPGVEITFQVSDNLLADAPTITVRTSERAYVGNRSTIAFAVVIQQDVEVHVTEQSTAPPQDIRTAFRLWRASIGATVLGSVLSIFIVDELARIRGQVLPPDLDPPQGDAYLMIGAAIGAAVVAAIGAVGLVVVVKMRAGRNWARVTLAVLGVVVVGYGLLTAGTTFALFGAGLVGGLVALLTIAALVLAAGAILAMFRPAASAYFAAR